MPPDQADSYRVAIPSANMSADLFDPSTDLKASVLVEPGTLQPERLLIRVAIQDNKVIANPFPALLLMPAVDQRGVAKV